MTFLVLTFGKFGQLLLSRHLKFVRILKPTKYQENFNWNTKYQIGFGILSVYQNFGFLLTSLIRSKAGVCHDNHRGAPPSCVHMGQCRCMSWQYPGSTPQLCSRALAPAHLIMALPESTRLCSGQYGNEGPHRHYRVDMPMHYSSAPVHRADCVTNGWFTLASGRPVSGPIRARTGPEG